MRNPFAQRLRNVMDDRGLKQVDLLRAAAARGLKLGKSQLSQYVSGKVTPRPEAVDTLAALLGVPAAWLAEGDLSGVGGNDAHTRVHGAGGSETRTPSPVDQGTVHGMDMAASPSTVGTTGPVVPTPARPGSTGAAATASVYPGPIGATAPATFDPAADPTAPAAADAAANPAVPAALGSAAAPNPAAPLTTAPGHASLASRSAPALSDPPVSPIPDHLIQRSPAMRQFKKSSKLDNVLYDVRGPVVDEAARMEAEGQRVLKLNIGNPAPFGFRTPDEVVQDMRQQLPDCEGYSDSRGLFSARKAIMQYSQIKGLPNVTMDDVYTGNGVSELINLCMQAILDTGDEVLIPSPDYPLWTACATLAGGTPVHYICDEQAEWNPDIDDIRAKITPRTKAIVIINPNNPTGALYSREVLEEIVEVAREHQLMILSDEIYDRLVMDGLEHVSIASLAPDLFCITFSGLSKSHMIAGYRIGWMVLSGNKRCARDLILGINMLSNMRLCSNVPAQSIVQTALWGHQSVKDYLVPGGRVYDQREFVYEALNKIDGITAVKPKAAFYIFPKIDVKKFNITDDEQFALDLLHEKHVLLVPGKGFNWGQPDHFRVVYLPRRRVLAECMDDIADFLAHYRQN